MPLTRHHKGMKIAASLAFFVGEGLQTLPDIAPRCLFSQEENAHVRTNAAHRR